ncbi:MAG: Na-translocating system protein MpsC family protein [Solirubrobacteraceae bacterium]
MMVTEGPLIDEAVLNAVSHALAELHKRHHGHPPTSAKSLMMGDDLLACVLRDIYTEVEKTMIGLDHHGVVRETRSAFQAAVRHRFIAVVERLSGRRVLSFITHHHIDPDLEVALFVLEPAPEDGRNFPLPNSQTRGCSGCDRVKSGQFRGHGVGTRLGLVAPPDF